MITVKFFGLLSLDHNVSQLNVQAGKVRDVLSEINMKYPHLSKEQLMQAVMIINKRRVTGKKRLSIELKNGDEMVLLNPTSGG